MSLEAHSRWDTEMICQCAASSLISQNTAHTRVFLLLSRILSSSCRFTDCVWLCVQRHSNSTGFGFALLCSVRVRSLYPLLSPAFQPRGQHQRLKDPCLYLSAERHSVLNLEFLHGNWRHLGAPSRVRKQGQFVRQTIKMKGNKNCSPSPCLERFGACG